MTAEEQDFVLGRYHAKSARDTFETKAVPRLESLAQRAPRVALPASLAAFSTSELYDRGRSRTPTANPIQTNEPCSATKTARPTWSHIHATKQRFPL
jgi:hypothetical protein